MGGPGVLFSRETLARVAPHVKHCLKNLYTTHEDVELGRCVQRFAGIPCTWSYEVSSTGARRTASLRSRRRAGNGSHVCLQCLRGVVGTVGRLPFG